MKKNLLCFFSDCSISAIDWHRNSGDHVCVIAQQEGDSMRNIFWFSKPIIKYVKIHRKERRNAYGQKTIIDDRWLDILHLKKAVQSSSLLLMQRDLCKHWFGVLWFEPMCSHRSDDHGRINCIHSNTQRTKLKSLPKNRLEKALNLKRLWAYHDLGERVKSPLARAVRCVIFQGNQRSLVLCYKEWSIQYTLFIFTWLETLTIAPCFFRAMRFFATICETTSAERQLTFITLSHASGVVSRKDWPIKIPALFTRRSTSPARVTAAFVASTGRFFQ